MWYSELTCQASVCPSWASAGDKVTQVINFFPPATMLRQGEEAMLHSADILLQLEGFFSSEKIGRIWELVSKCKKQLLVLTPRESWGSWCLGIARREYIGSRLSLEPGVQLHPSSRKFLGSHTEKYFSMWWSLIITLTFASDASDALQDQHVQKPA